MIESFVELSKSGTRFAQDQQWSLGDGHIQGVGSGCRIIIILLCFLFEKSLPNYFQSWLKRYQRRQCEST